MKRFLLRFWLQRFRRTPHRWNAGFTLIELLVVTLVGSLIMLSLLALINELLLVDRNEAVRLETNREMQLALDYMAEEVREATYIYTGHCLMAQADASNPALRCDDVNSRAIGNPTGGILPNAIASANDIPVLAFWKQNPLPEDLRDDCRNNANHLVGGEPAPCTIGSSYALVVYALSTDNPGGIWRGGARIKRYVLTEFNADGSARTPGYANPTQNNNNFIEWPYAAVAGPVDGANANAPVLVDFVDDWRCPDGTRGAAGATACADGTPINIPANLSCPDGYSISPHPSAFNNVGADLNGLRSFYACISPPRVGQYQEAILYLQGSTRGRTGGGLAPRDGSLTMLQTRVMARGVFDAD